MRLISGLAAVAVAATTLAPTAAVAAPVPPTQLATDWMVGELTDGLAVGTYGPDTGLSIDAGLAFDTTGRTSDAALVGDAIVGGLVGTGPYDYGYVKTDEYEFPEDVTLPPVFRQVGRYANATAKAAAFTQRIDRDAAEYYDDIDLIAQLEDLTDDTTGVIADDTSYRNYASTIGQAFAAEALTVAQSGQAPAATQALLDQQCPAGYFRFDLAATECATSEAAPSPDTTGIAVVALLRSGDTSQAVLDAVEKATDWLASVQLADGSFDGGAELPGSNANSTGLAGVALGRTGHAAAAAKAAAWVRSMQVADVGACASKAPIGALAYDAADLAAGRADGIASNATVRDKWRRASFQAAPALQWAPAANVPLGISVPSAAVEKSTVTATVRGLAAGEQGCASFGADARRVVGTGGDLALSFTLPAGAGARTFTVQSLAGTASATTAVTAIPVATPPAPTVPVVGELSASRVEKVRNNAFRLALACDDTEPCTGTIRVSTVGKVATGHGRRVMTVAKRSYALAPGREKQLALRLTKPGRKLLADGRIKVKAVQTAPGAERSVTKFWLKAARG